MSCRIGYDSDGKIRWDSRGCWFDSKVQWALHITLNQTLICSLEIPRNPFPKTPINPCFIHMSFHSFPSSARQPNEWGQQKTQLVNPASGSGNRLGLGRVRNGDSERWEQRYYLRSGTIYFVFVFDLMNESNGVILGIVINIEEPLRVFLIDNVSISDNWWWILSSLFYRHYYGGFWDRTEPFELADPGLL